MRRIRACAVVVLLAGLLAPAAQAPVATASPTTQAAPCPVAADAPKRQVRADWIATVTNIDWPSRPGLTPDQQKAELRGLLDQAVGRGLNAVVLQVRPTADTFWPSRYEPWSKYLTGTPGQDPGYDPLRFAVREAHARNLELHAWFNPYRVSMGTDRSALAPGSPAAQHPDWVKAYGGKLYYDPGLPQVRSLVENVIMDAVDRYDVDGVHFDDYFYPYPVAGQVFDDDTTFAAYGAGFPDTAQGRADWRRHNNDLLVSQLDQKIHHAKPWVKFGVSPFGVWRNQATDPEGSATTAGAQTYDDLYADTRKWVREGWLDYIAPQVYWALGFAPADYAVLVPWWADQVRGTGVQLYIGQASYKVGLSTQSPAWNNDPSEISEHLTFNQSYPEVDGDIYFSAKDVHANRLGHMDIVQREHYAHPALQPVTSGVPGDQPPAVTQLTAGRTADGVALTWHGQGSSYAVYRVDGDQVGPCDTADGTHLVATVHGTGSTGRWVDTEAPAGASTYVVTALDRAYRESGTGQPVTVGAAG